jgi:hypothetical protein
MWLLGRSGREKYVLIINLTTAVITNSSEYAKISSFNVKKLIYIVMITSTASVV